MLDSENDACQGVQCASMKLPTLLIWLSPFLGALGISLGAQATVPMLPVPMSLQTLAVLLLGYLAPPRMALLGGLLYLAAVLTGLPVLAEGKSSGGLAFFSEPSAGYVLAFVPAALLTAWMNTRGFAWGLAAGFVAHALILAVGLAVLSLHIGLADAWKHGVWPFLPGAVVKSLGAWGLAMGIGRIWQAAG